MEAVLAWLEANEPRFEGRRVLVHGDMGFQNLLVTNGEITGVLDWEMCHLGPPVEDLLYIRRFLAAGLSWEEFLEAYRAHGGQYEPCSNENFYGVCGLSRIAIGLYNILYALRERDAALDTKEIYIGTRYAERVALEAFKATL
jgi:aminoglycoside phosphotransferase (APT) family kinase protein